MASVPPAAAGEAPIRSFAEFWTYYSSQHRHRITRAAHVLAVAVAAAMIMTAFGLKRPALALLALPTALSIAWASHAFVERNRPTFLRYPVWAILAATKLTFHSVVDRILRPGTFWEWRNLQYEAAWRLTRNPASRARFRAQNPALDAVQKETALALRDRGVAHTERTRLGVDAGDWAALQKAAFDFRDSERVRAGVEAYREDATRIARKDAYMVTHFFPDEPLLAADDPFLRGVLAPPVLDVVNSYFGLWAKLMSVDVWYSIPHDIGRRIGSQKWHRDPEDRQMLKVYFYWSDVLDGAGPMEYVEGSAHAGGRMRSYRSWKPFDRVSRYPEENELEARIAEMKIQPVQCAGPAGTVFFCDTSGFHRGGVASTKARLLTVWTFVTPAAMEHVSVSRRYFRVDRSRGWDRLSEPARFALS